MTYRFSPVRFLLWFIGLSVGLPLLLLLIYQVTGFNLESSATTVIPVFIAAMMEGMAFAKAEGRAPTKQEAWQYARRMTLLVAIGSALLSLPLFVFFPQLFQRIIGASLSEVVIVAGLVVLFLLFSFVASRMFFGLGAKNHIKEIEKRAAKDKE